MNSGSGITVEQWLVELAKVNVGRPRAEGWTTMELVRQTGSSPALVRRMIRKGLDCGLMCVSGVRPFVRIDGRPATCIVYRATPPNKKSGRAK